MYITCGCESILNPILLAVVLPPIVACTLFRAAILVLNFEEFYNSTRDEEFDVAFTPLALIPCLLYMGVYCLFILAHTPRAVRVKQDKRSSALDVERASSRPSTEEAQWRPDRRSAFRPKFWFLAILMNAFASLISIPWAFVTIRHATGFPIGVSLLGMMLLIPLAAFINAFCSYRRPNLRHFFSLIQKLPCMYLLGGFFTQAWVCCYSFARISDLTWGNREGAHEELATSAIAARRASIGKRVALSLLFLNCSFFAGLLYWTIQDKLAVLYAIIFSMTPVVIQFSLHLGATIVYAIQTKCLRCGKKGSGFEEEEEVEASQDSSMDSKPITRTASVATTAVVGSLSLDTVGFDLQGRDDSLSNNSDQNATTNDDDSSGKFSF